MRQPTLTPLRAFSALYKKEEEATREISFQIPEGVSQSELLEHGFAIDGNSASSGVKAYFDDVVRETISLTEALHDEQVDLVKWLKEKGYDVEFA